MDIKERLKQGNLYLDGGMGTMLQSKGMVLGEIPELLGIKKSDWIIDIHRRYINAGAEVIYTNTFGANSYKLSRSEYSVDDVVHTAIANARKAAEGTDTYIALDIGPIGQLLEPNGSLSFEDAYLIYKEIIIAGRSADLIVFETMTDLCELKAAVLAAKENCSLPIICTMSFEDTKRTFTGCSISAMALTLEGLGVDAVGVNCSLGPVELVHIVEELMKWTTLPVIVKPNAGLPDPMTNRFTITADEFAEAVVPFLKLGVKAVGGCCGTTPDFIQSMINRLRIETTTSQEPTDNYKTNNQVESINKVRTNRCAVCSSTKTVVLNEPRVIGERINPTGKKLFKEALINQDIDYILKQAIDQVNAGADILDVNVGLPGIDEKEMMVKVIKELQSVVDVPLQIDSTSPSVIEAALRVYNGKPIVNSVNGEQESMDQILPLVKKYGASVVGLTLNKEGIPKTSEERFEVAKRILERALFYGIPKEDVYIDCLTLTASSEQEGVMETLKALSRVQNELGLKTVLGVSNISFGLPNRELINHNFLMMALMQGLTLPIINPNVDSMMDTLRSYKLLTNIDKNAENFIASYKDVLPAETKSSSRYISAVGNSKELGTTGNQVVTTDSTVQETDELCRSIENGLKADTARLTTSILLHKEPMEIINDYLIPTLDRVGSKFEQGKLFLPQLILSAAAAQAAFEVIKSQLAKTGEEQVNKGTIVLATVKGDVHDIGKNIVKVLLENYGYKIIDLGKNVPPEDVLTATVKYKASLVGLSALMTTTLKSMEETIDLLKANHVPCKVMVGGAVLNPEYAAKIGADYYCMDAKEAVDVAKLVYQQ